MNDALFNERFTAYSALAESYLAERVKLTGPVGEAMEYSLSSGGKRIRPVLSLAVCDMLCGEPERALPYACAVELIHTYSLIHDDLPCMDDDDFRRGKPSCHVAFGEAVALLAGDGLLTKAFSVAADGGNAEAIRVISENAFKMVLGQGDEFVNADKDISVDNILEIYAGKTSALLVAAAECGGIAAEADASALERIRMFAQRLGLAFQVRDDLLDAENEDCPLVVKLGTAGAEALAEKLSCEAAEALAGFDNNDFLLTLTEKLLHRNR